MLAAVVEAEGIEASDEELLESLERPAAAERTSPKKLFERLRSSGRLDSLRDELAQRKAIDRIADSAKPISVEQAQAREKLWTPGARRPGKGRGERSLDARKLASDGAWRGVRPLLDSPRSSGCERRSRS